MVMMVWVVLVLGVVVVVGLGFVWKLGLFGSLGGAFLGSWFCYCVLMGWTEATRQAGLMGLIRVVRRLRLGWRHRYIHTMPPAGRRRGQLHNKAKPVVRRGFQHWLRQPLTEVSHPVVVVLLADDAQLGFV